MSRFGMKALFWNDIFKCGFRSKRQEKHFLHIPSKFLKLFMHIFFKQPFVFLLTFSMVPRSIPAEHTTEKRK